MPNVEVDDNFTGASSNVVDVEKVFQQTHIQKDIGQYNDGRSRRPHENFETTLSQATSQVASYTSSSESTPLDPVKGERLKTQGSIEVASIKKRRWNNKTRQLTRVYRSGDDNLMDPIQTCSKRSHDSNETALLRQEVSALREDTRQLGEKTRRLGEHIEQLISWFQSYDVQNIWQQQQQQKDEQQQQQVDDHR